MTSRERILAVLEGRAPDRVPLTTWCFGFCPAEHLKWDRDGKRVDYWYSERLAHIHTLPGGWSLEDDFRRAEALASLGVDDALEISVPWSVSPEVSFKESRIEAGQGARDSRYPVVVREYQTPEGVETMIEAWKDGYRG